MNEQRFTPQDVGDLYDHQAKQYSAFAPNSFSWKYIERPAIARYIKPFITPDSQVLDIGTGTGRVIELLGEMGVREENITAFDVSQQLVDEAKAKYPKARLARASADDFSFSPESFDIAIANMVFHYLDNEQLGKALDNIYRDLKLGGKLCFIDSHPVHDAETMNYANNDKWIKGKAPWGEEIYIFNRDPYSLVDALDFGGFNWVAGWETLPVIEEGRYEPELFAHYSAGYSRAGYVEEKVDEERKKIMSEPGRNFVFKSI